MIIVKTKAAKEKNSGCPDSNQEPIDDYRGEHQDYSLPRYQLRHSRFCVSWGDEMRQQRARGVARTTVVIFCSDEDCTHSNENCDAQGMIMFGLQLVHDKERSPQPHVVSLAALVRILEES